jgi:hypothetical protein
MEKSNTYVTPAGKLIMIIPVSDTESFIYKVTGIAKILFSPFFLLEEI